MKKNEKTLKCLVTGSEGFVGSKLCTALHILGHEVIRYDRVLGSKFEALPDVDLVFHLAAQTDLKYSQTHLADDAMDNIILTCKLLERYPTTRFIYPASAASKPIVTPYGLSKQTAAEYIKLVHKDYAIVMFPNVYGPGGKGAINKFRESSVMTIFGDGEQTRTIVHVDDVVKALIMAIEWPTGEYSLGGEVLSINQIADKIGKLKVYEPNYTGNIFASVIENTTPDWEATIKL